MSRNTRSVVTCYERGRHGPAGAGPRVGVSLHSHSSCSRERLNFVPGVARNIPLVSRLFDRSVAQFGRALGHPLDFESVYWRPPASPEAVIASERRQIAERFDCGALVALTDHDTLEGPRRLRAGGMVDVPLSVEWSISIERTVLHLGVHGLPEKRLPEAMESLANGRGARSAAHVAELLDWFSETPETFVIVNHPFWDFTGVGALRHEALLLGFCGTHRDQIRWLPAQRLSPMAGEPSGAASRPGVPAARRRRRRIPVWHAPNAIVNLASCSSFEEFGRDMRGPSDHVRGASEGFEPFAARVFQGVREALTPDPGLQPRWLHLGECVFFMQDGVERSIKFVRPRGGPVLAGAAWSR